jgi:heme/copper-type cytochrome/quinol oxidase subunit 4
MRVRQHLAFSRFHLNQKPTMRMFCVEFVFCSNITDIYIRGIAIWLWRLNSPKQEEKRKKKIMKKKLEEAKKSIANTKTIYSKYIPKFMYAFFLMFIYLYIEFIIRTPNTLNFMLTQNKFICLRIICKFGFS